MEFENRSYVDVKSGFFAGVLMNNWKKLFKIGKMFKKKFHDVGLHVKRKIKQLVRINDLIIIFSIGNRTSELKVFSY